MTANPWERLREAVQHQHRIYHECAHYGDQRRAREDVEAALANLPAAAPEPVADAEREKAIDPIATLLAVTSIIAAILGVVYAVGWACAHLFGGQP